MWQCNAQSISYCVAAAAAICLRCWSLPCRRTRELRSPNIWKVASLRFFEWNFHLESHQSCENICANAELLSSAPQRAVNVKKIHKAKWWLCTTNHWNIKSVELLEWMGRRSHVWKHNRHAGQKCEFVAFSRYNTTAPLTSLCLLCCWCRYFV